MWLRDIGKMDDRLSFEERSAVSDGAGGSTLVWTARFSRQAAIAWPQLARTQEAISSGAIQHSINCTATLRADSKTRTVTAEWRVRFGGRLYNIRALSAPYQGMIRMSLEAGGTQ